MSSFIRYLVSLQKIILFICSLLIAATFGAVVVLRYGFNANLFAYEEWILVVAFTLYFIGAAQGSYDNTHIKADLINEWIVNPVIKRRFNLAMLALEIIICSVLSYWGFLMVADDLMKYPNLPATIVYKIPLTVPRSIIFIGFVLMTFYTAIHFLRLYRQKAGMQNQITEGDL